MNYPEKIARGLREVYFGRNWTAVDLKGSLQGMTWEMASSKIGSHHSIAVLVYHIHYYVRGVARYLKGGIIDTQDKYSFDLPIITNDEEWEQFLTEIFAEAEAFSQLIEGLSPEKLEEDFKGESYGCYFRNITGLIEHAHYHLGQIVLLKKLMA